MLKWILSVVILLGLLRARPVAAYSVLTHQANVDSTWEPCMLPLLQSRYPGATADELIEAKSFAYGGSILQDMGYYPFGSELFTNLTHYVRSGDFVRNLLDEAHSRNEYAFALGRAGPLRGRHQRPPRRYQQGHAQRVPRAEGQVRQQHYLRGSPDAAHPAGVCLRCGAGGLGPLPHAPITSVPSASR